MKILQLCHKPPFPPVDGGAIAMNNISQGILKAGHQLKIISVATAKHPVDLKALGEEYLEKTQFESVFLDTSIKARAAFLNLFSSKSYNIERFICPKLEATIVAVLKEQSFDVVIFEGLFVTPYFRSVRANSSAKMVLRAHNVEYKIWDRMSYNAHNPLKKAYLKLLSKRLKKFEVKTFKRMDGICAMTAIDAEIIQSECPSKKLAIIPSGYLIEKLTEVQYKIKPEPQSIFHIASMNWQPNFEAVDWFLNQVWSQVIGENNTARLYLAGREMPKSLIQKADEKIIIAGEVPDAKVFYLSKEIMIVPLLSGSGMRIKIIEGMALGKIIVSTSIGAEGINCTHNKNILIADTPQEFANCLIKVLNDKEFCKTISKNAQELIANEYNNDLVCNQLFTFFNELN